MFDNWHVRLYHNHLFSLIVILSLLLLIPLPLLCQPSEYISIKTINKDYLEYVKYERKKEVHRIDLSDLSVANNYLNIGDPIHKLFGFVPDFKIILLENGIAELKNHKIAATQYKEAQERAKNNKAGIWKERYLKELEQTLSKPPKPPKPSRPEEPPKDLRSNNGSIWKRVFAYIGDSTTKLFFSITNTIKIIWKWIALLGLSGSIIMLIYFKIVRKWKERKIRILLLGDTFSGKTALWKRLDDPRIPEEQILSLTPSSGTEKRILPTIQQGRYELIPCATDTAGTKQSTVWDMFYQSIMQKLLFKSPMKVILFVLAPSEKQDEKVQNNYIYTQLGILRTYIEGGIRSDYTHKPKVMILFLNKFDLFSSLPPEDSASIEFKREFEAHFKEHIQRTRKVGDNLKIHTHVIIGSALKNWNCETIMNLIKHDLYPKSKRSSV